MDTQNHLFLQNCLLALGFHQHIGGRLADQLRIGAQAFLLHDEAMFGDNHLFITIYVKRWEDCPLYYLRKYHAVLQRPDGTDDRGHDFFFSRMYPMITLTEAADLLNGRPVYRESCRHKEQLLAKTWLQLDLTRKDACGNFCWIYQNTITSLPHEMPE